MVHYSLEPSGP